MDNQLDLFGDTVPQIEVFEQYGLLTAVNHNGLSACGYSEQEARENLIKRGILDVIEAANRKAGNKE